VRAEAGAGRAYQEECELARRVAELDPGGQPLRVALLSSATLDHFAPIVTSRLTLNGFKPELFVPPFNTVGQLVSDANSAFYSFAPDIVWLMTHHRDVLDDDDAAAVAWLTGLWSAIAARTPACIVQSTVALPGEQAAGNLELMQASSRTASLRRINQRLLERAVADRSVVLFDVEHVAAEFGLSRWHEARWWHHSKHAFAFDACGLLAHRFARLAAAIRGRSARCVVLDLDNTLWGGVVGEVGVAGLEVGEGADGEAFVAFQHYLKELRQRGILLAVCSKNDDTVARQVFTEHADMRLRLEDFASFHMSWEPKPTMLLRIAEELGLAPEHLVFVDDDPVERDLVRSTVPAVWVPDLPDDPADYVAALDGMRYFEATGATTEDTSRTELYRQNQERRQLQEAFVDVKAYLRSLDMRASISAPSGLALQRAVQLLNKTNQFNLNGERLTEAALQARLEGHGADAFCVRLADRFGDNGIIAFVALSVAGTRCEITSWVMSCRVLARGVEELVLEEIVRRCTTARLTRLEARWRDTGRNHLAREALARLGFACEMEEADGQQWVLALPAALPPHCIAVVASEVDHAAVT
jgi:FkbH-like protein